MNNSKIKISQKLAESGLMIALATILSLLKVVSLPYGGSVTLASMLPIIVIAYRYGTGWGLLTGLADGLIQFILDSSVLSWVTGWKAVVAVIVLDYLAAFTAAGLAGIFRKLHSQRISLLCGSLLACTLRYFMHVISGCTVWAGLSIPTSDALAYSFVYNASYMIPETIIACVAALYVGGQLNFSGVRLSAAHNRVAESRVCRIFGALGGLLISGGCIADVILVFPKLQNADGEFDITMISSAPWITVAIVSAACLVTAAVFLLLRARLIKKTAHTA